MSFHNSLIFGVPDGTLNLNSTMEDKPVVVIEELVTGSGAFQRLGAEVPVTSFAAQRPKYGTTHEWIITGTVAHVPAEVWTVLHRPGIGAVALHGKSDTGHDVLVPVVHISTKGQRFHATAPELWIGPREILVEPAYQRVTATLWDTHLAHPEVEGLAHWWTGEIKADGDATPSRAPTMISTRFGLARLSLQYAFESAIVGGTQAVIRVPKATVSLNLDAGARSTSHEQIIKAMLVDLKPVIRVLSLLSRRHVRCSRVTVTTRSASDYAETTWITASSASTGGRREPLVNSHRTPPDAVERMARTLEASNYSEALSSAIVYVVAAYDADFVDSRLASAYTAFEAVINALSEDDGSVRTLNPSAFRRLTRKLRAQLRAFVDEEGLSDAVATTIARKLTELQRRPIVDRAAEIIERARIQWEDLWAPGSSLKTALADAYRRRDRFIHRGELGSPLRASIDATRVITLTERLLFSLLGGDSAWFDAFSFRESPHLAFEEQEEIQLLSMEANSADG